MALYCSEITCLSLKTLYHEQDLVRYALILRAEGFDSPADIDYLTLDELGKAPFAFKRGK